MTLLIATQNRHKLDEVRAILPEHEVQLPEDLGIEFSFEETGTTYLENSLGKAMHLHRLTGKAVLADDSGLSVPALSGEPGVYSARYGSRNGVKLDTPERNAYLLAKMEGIRDRRAFFVCAMVLVMNEYRFYTVQETLDGVLTEEPRGSGGFGYDPLLFLPELGKTVAQLSEEEKNRISHRGKAGALMREVLRSIERS